MSPQHRDTQVRRSSHQRRNEISEEKIRKEEFAISGEKLVSTVKKLVRQGNIRRVTIKNKE
ncbi:DUF4342 domain-containing protein, partial [Candidatus Bipolaricaulota bacterium]|nr:DUF4342 domain-containing protein [Candidatus Bipolaricaulota bacterium]